MSRRAGILILACLLGAQFCCAPIAQAQAITLPKPGARLGISPASHPLMLKGITVDPVNPFSFQFIADPGDAVLSPDVLNDQANTLIKYFLASLTVPEKDQWVNLSPYEHDRILPDNLAQTELGRDMLAQDYILKQLTASLIYPEGDMGKEFWSNVYKNMAGHTAVEVSINTFNKVWITADRAKVYVHDRTALIVSAHLKVLMDSDYTAGRKHGHDMPRAVGSDEVFRSIVLPAIEKEVNEGRNFAPLRQMFHSMVLAAWFKKNLRQAVLTKSYADQSKTAGIDINGKVAREAIYERYIQAYKKGVFNYVKDADTARIEPRGAHQEQSPRKYFAGGVIELTKALEEVQQDDPDLAMAAGPGGKAWLSLDVHVQRIHKTLLKFDGQHPFVLPQINKLGKLVIGAFELTNKESLMKAAHEFVEHVSSLNLYKYKEARTKFREHDIVNAVADFFIQWYEHKLDPPLPDGDLVLSNEEILKRSLRWMEDAQEKWDPKQSANLGEVLKGKNILMTGGSGSLGTFIVTNLAKVQGAHIISFQRHALDPKEAEQLKIVQNEGEGTVFHIYGDLKDEDAVEYALRKVREGVIRSPSLQEAAQRLVNMPATTGDNLHADKTVGKAVAQEMIDQSISDNTAVVHFGGRAIINPNHPEDIFANLLNTRNVLMKMKTAGAKTFIFASSVTVHEPHRSTYAFVKYLEEKLIQRFCDVNGMQYIILRLPNIIEAYKLGKEDKGDKQNRLIPSMVYAAKTKTDFHVNARVNRKIGFIDIEELSTAVGAALRRLFDHHGTLIRNKSATVDLQPLETYSIEEIANKVNAIDKNFPLKPKYPAGMQDIEAPKLNQFWSTYVLGGWKPRLSLPEMLSKVWQLPLSALRVQVAREERKSYEEEAAGLARIYNLAVEEDMPWSNADRVEILLSLLVPSMKAFGERHFYAGQVKRMESLIQERLREFHPDHQLNYVDHFSREDKSEILKLLSDYQRYIVDQGNHITDPVDREHHKYIEAIRRLWGRSSSKPGRDARVQKAIAKSGERADAAQTNGGIDFNAARLDLDVEGQQAVFDGIDGDNSAGTIEGLVPYIIHTAPITNIANMLGLNSAPSK